MNKGRVHWGTRPRGFLSRRFRGCSLLLSELLAARCPLSFPVALFLSPLAEIPGRRTLPDPPAARSLSHFYFSPGSEVQPRADPGVFEKPSCQGPATNELPEVSRDIRTHFRDVNTQTFTHQIICISKHLSSHNRSAHERQEGSPMHLGDKEYLPKSKGAAEFHSCFPHQLPKPELKEISPPVHRCAECAADANPSLADARSPSAGRAGPLRALLGPRSLREAPLLPGGCAALPLLHGHGTATRGGRRRLRARSRRPNSGWKELEKHLTLPGKHHAFLTHQ